MNRYRYKATNENGSYVTGRMSAENAPELASMLGNDGLDLISYNIEKQSSLSFLDKVRPKDLIAMFIHLEQMDKAGLNIIDSLNDIKENSDSQKIRNLMHEIYESVRKGSLFSESLAKHPEIFSKVYVGLIAAGEKTGNLSIAFASIVDDIKWNLEIKRKARKATIGPSFGIFMMFIVMLIMTTVVVPKVTGFLQSQEIDLPGTTTSLIAFSDFFRGNILLIIFVVPSLWISIKLASKNEEIGTKMDAIKLRIPIIGPILNKIDAAKFCQFFAMTFKSGLGVLECLDASSGAVKNRAMKLSINTIKQQVSDGQSLAKAITSTGYFPNLVSQMFKIGEESGNMESSLENINFFYEREINDSIDRIVGMIQPTLTIVMGGMIAWITIAVFGPIYGTFSNIG